MQNNKTQYINHTLNNSPSKTAYSFSRSVRFPTYSHEYGVVILIFIIVKLVINWA